MRLFLKKISLFILFLTLFSILADRFISNGLKSLRRGEFGVWQDVFNEMIHSEIYIYGSSRAWVHISPKILAEKLNKTVYNWGIDGHNFWLQELRHKKLMKKSLPKLIIQSLDVYTLCKRDDLYNLEQFLPYLGDAEICAAISDYKGFSFFDFHLPMKRYLGRFPIVFESIATQFSLIKRTVDREKGYKGQEKAWNKDFENARRKANYIEMDLDQKTILRFEQYLQWCKDKGIKLALVYTPEFFEGQNYVRNRSQIMDLFKSLAEKYSIALFDYSDHDISKDKTLFYNVSHMNKSGAEKFSAILANDLKTLF